MNFFTRQALIRNFYSTGANILPINMSLLSILGGIMKAAEVGLLNH